MSSPPLRDWLDRALSRVFFPTGFNRILCRRQWVREPYPRWGEEIILPRPDGDSPLCLRLLRAPAAARARAGILIVHGMNEYIGRYAEIAHRFARRFEVAGFDLYAHGLSNPCLAEADRALRAGAKTHEVGAAYLAQAPLNDLEPMRRDLDNALRRFIELCDGDDPTGKPVFLLTHSLGSLIAASYLLREADAADSPAARVQGVVFLGPAFSVTQVPGWRGLLENPIIRLSFHAQTRYLAAGDGSEPERALHRILASATIPLLDGLFEFLSRPGWRSVFTPGTPGWVVNYLTDWETERARHRADGWIVRRSLLRYVKGVEREIVGFRRRMGEFSLPYFLVYSGHDPITPAWGNQDFVRATLGRHSDSRVLSLPELSHHEHLFSAPPLRDELLEKIEAWLHGRLTFF